MFKDKHCLIYNPTGLDIFTIKIKENFFSLDYMEEKSAAFSSTANQTELWHKRLRYFNLVTLVHTQKKKMVQGMPNMEEETSFYTSCQYGK